MLVVDRIKRLCVYVYMQCLCYSQVKNLLEMNGDVWHITKMHFHFCDTVWSV